MRRAIHYARIAARSAELVARHLATAGLTVRRVTDDDVIRDGLREAQLDGNPVKIRDAEPGSAGPARATLHSPFKTFAPRRGGPGGTYPGRRPPPHYAGKGGRKFRGHE